MGLARNELMTPSVKRVGLRSPFFARRMIFFATDVAMRASWSATFNRFKTSSKAVVIAAVSSGPNAVLISKRIIGYCLHTVVSQRSYRNAKRDSAYSTYHCCHEQE